MSDTGPDPVVELKARQREAWSLGSYDELAEHVIPTLGAILVEALDIGPGERVLDVAAGTGSAALAAALRGAEVVASDLAPALLRRGREHARLAGVHLRWEEADAEELPYADGEFDVVLSCVGVMFAPRHQRSADELVRVTRPGGRIGLLSWTPDSFNGRLATIMGSFLPPPPDGVLPPPLWGEEAHVRDLLGQRVERVQATQRTLRVAVFDSGAEFRDYFRRHHGPTMAAYAFLAEHQPDRVAELDDALARLADEAMRDGVMDWDYLLLTAVRT